MNLSWSLLGDPTDRPIHDNIVLFRHAGIVDHSTLDVSRLTGASYRQLDYWDHAGWLSPSIRMAEGSGAGKRRVYSDEDVKIAKVLVLLSQLREDAKLPAEVTDRIRQGCRHFTVGFDAVKLSVNLDAVEE